MNSEPEIVTINSSNLANYPEVVCFINKKHPDHSLKPKWIEKRFEEGLRVKLLYIEEKKKAAGFLEYLPGENA